jgi:nitroreductase
MNAARLCQWIYLVATATGIGCCGIAAFYDQEAAALLALHDQSRLLYMAAVGPVRK